MNNPKGSTQNMEAFKIVEPFFVGAIEVYYKNVTLAIVNLSEAVLYSKFKFAYHSHLLHEKASSIAR